ncbi:MAG: Hsp70 family protein [Myxococcales bacterium]|nr:Hsp70 family protein [Myxococcales bacterium]
MSVVGIDLGTTNTVVASMRSGRVNVLGDESGQRLLPSVVSFHPNGEVLVGNPAKARRAMDPRNTVASHKRLLGRSWNSPEIVQARSRVPYELREGPAQGPLVHARGKDYTLPEISAFVLKRAKQIAETALGEPVMRAVITVPAHFNELQRASTKVAGRVSGLEVLRILNEPTAAALAYGLGRVGSERIAVYDFGGGTFDCTLLDLNNNVFEVLATAGDTFLGGDDVDAAIAERMAERLLKQHRIDAKADPGTWERLRAAAEELKIHLSTRDQAQVKINDLGYGVGGAALALTFAMTRGELDQLIQPLVDRTFRVTQDALALARLTPTSFDKVVLVGGSSRIPLVRRRVEAFFGAPPMDRINPDEVVAMGAAIQASALTDGAGKRPIPAPPPVPSANPHTLRGLQDEEFTQVKPPSTASAPPYATGSAPPPLGQRESNPPYASRSAPPPLGDTTSTGVTHDANRFGSVSGAIHDPRRDDEPSIPSFSGAPVPPHSEFYEAVKGSRPRLDEIEDSEAGWVTADDEEDSATLTGSSPPLAAQTGEFGTLDEPPSLVSSISGQGMARVPSFDDLGDTAAVPGGTFGEIRDLSLISSSGISSPSLTGVGPSSEEMDTNQQPAPVLAMKGAPPPSIPEIPFGPMAEFTPRPAPSPAVPSKKPSAAKTAPLAARNDPRAEPADPRKTTDPYGGFAAKGGPPGVPGTGARPNPLKSTDPMGGSPKRTDPLLGQRAQQATTQPLAPPQAVIPTSRPAPMAPGPEAFPSSPPPLPPGPPQGPRMTRNLPAQNVPPEAFRSSPPPVPAPAPPGVGVGAGGGASAFAGASGAYPAAAGSGGFPAQSGGFPAITPDYPVQHAQIHAQPHVTAPMPGFGSAPPPMMQGMPQPTMQGMPQPTMQGMQPHMMQGMPQGPMMGQPMGAPGMMPGMSPYGGMPAPSMAPPVLVDVTPRALVVETAGGFCDTVIPRNAKIPCERTRKFSTGRDHQTSVRVRVAQGESSVFAQNTYLGEVELSGLRPAGRGEVTVAVTFELDADGTLKVRAADSQTGHEARATLRLLGVADEESVVDMIQRMGEPSPGLRV